ncbi:acetoin dehydrogenase dihydrolipoyllysine-residue acetyltransferase subunit [Paracoccus aerius]|uniref:Acetoin dehydrogenase dihydrolipoyllysine-residue acetyltransferase subunit n=1 Tax=Paracoccus aerius TaxID=1915382 RepID=A0ABS1SBW1_9RHOB|nr:acetoin dehydrogenase dihydrolipoyllysine-residue acetyltransferase subunit [Paracoccus aerius]MBL3674996.1 acetoin dehydrogenase dihydrolipoyllysine-residue acetyltransferase subunit [Paracoccus aerius]GHG31808.1 acetoin dehydrogenase dihydrolipoyllysine-residue acetyltransferase subunit [Paracoccus aerius]
MNSLTLTMPRLGETMDEGVIVGWMVAPGEAFKRGQPILELETDKTVVEFPALGDGMLEETFASPGDRIEVGKPIARAKVFSEADWADENAAPAEATVAEEATPVSILRMPKLGETMDEGVISSWLVAEGAAYARGDAILEVETDKTVAEVPALYEGRLLRILAQPGEKLPVGAPIAEVEGRVEEVAGEAAVETAHATVPVPAIPRPGASSDRLRATPLARRLARQNGIALDQITGTGRRGRIERADVQRLSGGAAPAAGDLQWLQTPVGRVAYTITGTGGRVHLLVHGFAGDGSAWAQLSAAIARAGHTAVALDLPGHGATEAEGPHLAALADAVTRLAETLPAGATLVGHSLGAAAAVAAASRLGSRVARLVLLTPAGCGPRIGADFVHGMAQADSSGEVAHLLRLLGPKGGALSDAALRQMAGEMARRRLKDLAAQLATPDGRQRIDILRPLAQLDLPVSAVFGTDDRIVAATDALNLPLNVAAHFLPTGHMPQWDAPRELADFILNGGKHG